MGKQWATITDDAGKLRLDNPGDFVRIEVESVLARGDMLVIPILVGGANMPKPDQLPEGLRGLPTRNAFQVRPDPDFHKDLDALIAAIKQSQTVAKA